MTGGFRDHFTDELGDAGDRPRDGRVHSSWSGSHPARLDHSRVDRRMACGKACPRPGLWLHRGHSPGIDRVGSRRLDLHEAGHRAREYLSDFTRSRDGRSSCAGFNCASFFRRPQPVAAPKQPRIQNPPGATERSAARISWRSSVLWEDGISLYLLDLIGVALALRAMRRTNSYHLPPGGLSTARSQRPAWTRENPQFWLGSQRSGRSSPAGSRTGWWASMLRKLGSCCYGLERWQ